MVRIGSENGSRVGPHKTPFISGVVIVGDGAVWISGGELPTAANKVIGRLDPKTNELVATIHVEEEGHGSFATSLFDVAAGEGSLWVSTHEASLVRIDTASNKVAARYDAGATMGGVGVDASSIWVTSTRGSCSSPSDALNSAESLFFPAGSGVISSPHIQRPKRSGIGVTFTSTLGAVTFTAWVKRRSRAWWTTCDGANPSLSNSADKGWSRIDFSSANLAVGRRGPSHRYLGCWPRSPFAPDRVHLGPGVQSRE